MQRGVNKHCNVSLHILQRQIRFNASTPYRAYTYASVACSSPAFMLRDPCSITTRRGPGGQSAAVPVEHNRPATEIALLYAPDASSRALTIRHPRIRLRVREISNQIHEHKHHTQKQH